MSLFGTSPPRPSRESSFTRSRQSLFDDELAAGKSTGSNSLFADDDLPGSGSGGAGAGSAWDMPSPRKQQTRADLLRSLLPASDAPDSYTEVFDAVAGGDRDGSGSGRIGSRGVARTLAAAKLGADDHARVMGIVAPGGVDSLALGRNEFCVLLALVGLAQEGETVSLDSVDERRRNLPSPKLPGLVHREQQAFAGVSELAAIPPQRPVTPPSAAADPSSSPARTSAAAKPSMEFPEADPWATPDVHKNHNHADIPTSNGHGMDSPALNVNGGKGDYGSSPVPARTTSNFAIMTTAAANDSNRPSGGDTGNSDNNNNEAAGWGFFNGNQAGGGYAGSNNNNNNNSNTNTTTTTTTTTTNNNNNNPTYPFGAGGGVGDRGGPGGQQPAPTPSRTLGSGRTGSAIEENVVVSLMPEKEGIFMFQHHNYEVSSSRRGSKVVRRYSDFVWLLDCLQKRYPFRVLPLLPPKRVAVNGNHLSNDGAFIEKRRRGLARFLNGLVRHPVLGQEQLVIMFLTVPTELSVWRKQATISVQDEFAGRPLPPGLEESLNRQLNDLFDRTRAGVRRSAELYINVCSVMDRLVKRGEGVAADHARIAMSLSSLTEASADTYATDTNDVPLLNDGLTAMSKHLHTSQSLMEDEARAWDAGVLEDLKRQRDALVSVRDLFERRERLDKDNIPYLERRIQTNEAKLASLRSKPDGMVKPGEIEKVVEAIIKDKESIVNQHNRSVFVRECIRDELVYFQQTQYHVSRWNQDWAQERVKYAEMLADNWRRLLDELDGMPLGE